MKQLKDWIKERQALRLFGRTQELQQMNKWLIDLHAEWRLVHFFGHDGAGKTTLLRKFEQVTVEAPVLLIHSPSGFETPHQFLQQLGSCLLNKSLIDPPSLERDLTQALNNLAEDRGRLVLLLDDLDQWREITGWLHEEWIPSLSTNVRICSTGRTPLQSYHVLLWDELIVNEPLMPFSPAPSKMETVAEGGWTEWLEAAAILKFFDHPLLEQIMGRSLTPQQFGELCSLPYIARAGEQWWTVIDDVRRKLRMKCKIDSPLKSFSYKQRAECALDSRLLQNAPKRRWYEYELGWRKFSMIDNDFVQGILFCGHDEGYSERAAHADELPVLERMLSYNIDTLMPYKIDEILMQTYTTKIWSVQPDAVQAVHREDRLVGLYFWIPLNAGTRRVLAQNPITQSFIEIGTVEENDYFVYTVASLPAFDFQIFGHILRKLIFTEAAGKRITFLLPMRDQADAFCLLGFKHLEWAQYHSIGGLTMFFVQLDLRSPVPLPALFSQQSMLLEPLMSISAKITEELPRQIHIHSDFREWESLVKELLVNYKYMHSPKIKEVILLTFRQLKSGSETEQVQAQILEHRYLQNRGSHENIAAMLFMPIATYYRHLKRLIATIAQAVRTEFFKEIDNRSLYEE